MEHRCSCRPRPPSRWEPRFTEVSTASLAARAYRILILVSSRRLYVHRHRQGWSQHPRPGTRRYGHWYAALPLPRPHFSDPSPCPTARQVSSKFPTQILDLSYRKRQLEFRRKQISQWLENETELLKFEMETKGAADKIPEDYVSERLASIESEAKRQESEALSTFGMLSGSDPSVSPLRRALAVWGLTIDDVGVASVSLTFLSRAPQIS